MWVLGEGSSLDRPQIAVCDSPEKEKKYKYFGFLSQSTAVTFSQTLVGVCALEEGLL